MRRWPSTGIVWDDGPMDLHKLSPSMLMALGLAACEMTACLSFADEGPGTTVSGTGTGGTGASGTSGAGTGATGTGATGTVGTSSTGMADEAETGPCLGIPPPETSSGTDTGMGSGAGTGTGSDSGSGSGSGSGGATGTTGMMVDPPPDRATALRRVLDRGALPDDVAVRLRAKTQD